MQVALISMAAAHALWAEHPHDAGSFALYTSRADKAEEMRQTKTFGCRHCQHRNINPETAQPLRRIDDHMERRFTFNGLVSHAKEKCASGLFSRKHVVNQVCVHRHKIFPMCDEDFFRDARAAADGEQSQSAVVTLDWT